MKKAEVFILGAARSYDKLYHYELPEQLVDQAKAGMRVLVPFGPANKKQEAMLVRIFEDASEKLKPVYKILDKQELVSEEFFSMLEWMKVQYICSYGDVLKCMVPPGLGITLAKKIVLRNETFKGTPAEERILQKLRDEQGEADFDTLKEILAMRDFLRIVTQLQNKNVIEVLETVKTKVKEKTIRVAFLHKDPQVVFNEIQGDQFKRIQHIRVLELLLENEYIACSDLIQFAGVSSSVLQTLQRNGYIEFGEIEVMRDPYSFSEEKTLPLKPTKEQDEVIRFGKESLQRHRFCEMLIHGVTGSGKTEVYLQLIEHSISMNRQAIVLVPEISLTPQMVKRFKGRFGENVAVIHSRLSFGERYDQWRKMKEGKVSVVVGARSAIFAPFQNLGIIIIDEEHEPSYKSEMKPKYHALDIARWRSKYSNALLLLGSATPAVETYYRAKSGEIELMEMNERANAKTLPKVDIIDMRQELEQGNRSIFSHLLEQGIRKNKELGQQGILFINRRGYSSFVLCRSCGYVMHCKYCHVSLTYHQNQSRLICHYCGFTEKNPTKCPKCSSQYIRDFGIGTQKVEEEIKKRFEGFGVIRMDMDTTTKKNSHEVLLKEFEQQQVDLLVGTQMIAKGHDFPNVTLVGILAADSMLNTGDIRAPERTFQLLTQSAGRAGRGKKEGRVIIQVYNVDHYSVVAAAQHNYKEFYKNEIKLRQELEYPPFTEIAVVLVSGTDDLNAKKESETILTEMREYLQQQREVEKIKILGLSRAPLSKIKGKYRWRIVLKSEERDILIRVLTYVSDKHYKNKKDKVVEISIDINPYSLL